MTVAAESRRTTLCARLLGMLLAERLGGGALGGVLAIGLEPARLGIHADHTHAAAAAPRTGELAGRATEAGYHLTGAAAGHTLPRLMWSPRLIAAVAIVASHWPPRLAFRT